MPRWRSSPGPCAVESREQLLATARWVKREGATLLRGGAFKPRSSPYAFQGLGIEGLQLLAEAREETGLPVVSEITDPGDVGVFERYVDVLQIGARNMANFVLLRAVGQTRKPVLLKRGISATIEEWLMAAEYILSSGNPNVILCERGIRTFETATRNTLDLSAVPVIRERTHLPILVDPSHGTGHRSLVRPLAVAGAAVGADGIIIEVHPDPPAARSDSEQSLSFPEFGDLMDDLRRHEYLRHPTAHAAYAPTEPPAERRRLRARIDDVDARLAALLEERAELSVAVQQTRSTGEHGHDVSRERELLERASQADGGVLMAEEREAVFATILRVSRSAQRRNAAAREAAAASGLAAGSPARAGTPGAAALAARSTLAARWTLRAQRTAAARRATMARPAVRRPFRGQPLSRVAADHGSAGPLPDPSLASSPLRHAWRARCACRPTSRWPTGPCSSTPWERGRHACALIGRARTCSPWPARCAAWAR